MSYAPSSSRPGRDARAATGRGAGGAASARPDPELHPPAGTRRLPADAPLDAHRAHGAHDVPGEPELDWGQIGTFGAGILVGALVGAGAALLLAPHSGAATRRAIRRRARFLREDAHDAWDDLGEGLRQARLAAKRKRRAMRRKLERRRWALADAVAGDRPDAC